MLYQLWIYHCGAPLLSARTQQSPLRSPMLDAFKASEAREASEGGGGGPGREPTPCSAAPSPSVGCACQGVCLIESAYKSVL